MKPRMKKSIKFSIMIAVITFVLAAIFSVISSSILSEVAWMFGLILVLMIVLIGVLFDMLGIAATAAHESPFHAMASEKVPGSKEAVVIIRHADKFASFCNDVIGDISGIVSGTATAIVVIKISQLTAGTETDTVQVVLNVVLTSFVAAITVGGKAIGKTLAIHKSDRIIYFTGKIVFLIENKLKIRVLPKEKK